MINTLYSSRGFSVTKHGEVYLLIKCPIVKSIGKTIDLICNDIMQQNGSDSCGILQRVIGEISVMPWSSLITLPQQQARFMMLALKSFELVADQMGRGDAADRNMRLNLLRHSRIFFCLFPFHFLYTLCATIIVLTWLNYRD